MARKSGIEHDLRALAYHGQMTVYDFAEYDTKRHHIREGSKIRYYPSALRAMKRLKKSGLVKISDHRTGKKGARTILYDLTLRGLATIIPMLSVSEIHQASEKHRDLLAQVFDLWSSFSQGSEALAAQRLKEICRLAAIPKEKIPVFFLHPTSDFGVDEATWGNVISENEKLRGYSAILAQREIRRPSHPSTRICERYKRWS